MTTKVIIVGRETFLSSLCKDLAMFLLFSALIGIGILTGSSAMQWTGFMIVAFIVLSWSTVPPKERSFTIDEARKELDRMEREVADG